MGVITCIGSCGRLSTDSVRTYRWRPEAGSVTKSWGAPYAKGNMRGLYNIVGDSEDALRYVRWKWSFLRSKLYQRQQKGLRGRSVVNF